MADTIFHCITKVAVAKAAQLKMAADPIYKHAASLLDDLEADEDVREQELFSSQAAENGIAEEEQAGMEFWLRLFKHLELTLVVLSNYGRRRSRRNRGGRAETSRASKRYTHKRPANKFAESESTQTDCRADCGKAPKEPKATEIHFGKGFVNCFFSSSSIVSSINIFPGRVEPRHGHIYYVCL